MYQSILGNICSREGKTGYTHICLVKQLLCLYPFPQRSHLSSTSDLFPSPFMRCEPSLARLLLCLMLIGLPAFPVPAESSSETALLLFRDPGTGLRSTAAMPFLAAWEEGPNGDEEPAEVDSRPAARRSERPRRWWEVCMGAPALAPDSLITADEVMLFRRVTRWL